MTELQLLSVGYVVFVALIAGELIWSKTRADGNYRLGEFVVNIGHGAVFQVFDGFTKFLVLGPFLFLSAFAPIQLPTDAAWGWLLGVLVFDFMGYWRHRHHHEIGALWAIHGVHHSASDYNFAAALRQALFQNVTGWLWTAPLALVMPLEMFVVIAVFDYVYQFVQHTRYVPKLGALEWVMNTPSHHRVHHGTEAHYLDKNYGCIFIVWDRLFGTFQEEQAEPTYGITKPLTDLNPVWGNLALWGDLAKASAAATGWRDKLAVWLGPPDAVDRVAPGVVVRDQVPLEDDQVDPARFRYVAASFVGLPVLLGALAWVPPEAIGLRLAIGALLIGSTVTPGGLLEGRSWAPIAELVRLGGTAGLALILLASGGHGLVVAALGLLLACAALGGASTLQATMGHDPSSARL